MHKQKVTVLIILFLTCTGILFGQYKRGAYEKKLLLIPRQDARDLPITKKFRILRSIGKDTHVAVFDMKSIILYLDRDNTTEDTIDVVYKIDPYNRNRMMRIENPFGPGEFSRLKEDIMKKGMKKDYASFNFKGIDYFLSYAKKNRYSLLARGSGYLVQQRDPDRARVITALGLNKTKKNLTIKKNFYLDHANRPESGIIYPVNAINSSDPTVLKVINEASAALKGFLSGRK